MNNGFDSRIKLALSKEFDAIVNNASSYRDLSFLDKRKMYDSLIECISNNDPRLDKESMSFARRILDTLAEKNGFPRVASIIRQKNSVSDYEFDNMTGTEFENYCVNLLYQNDYTNIITTKISGDQGVDIIAEKNGLRYAVQCKCYSSNIGNKAIQEVVAGAQFYKCQISAVMTNRYFTSSAQELAEETGTLLWDRDKIIEMQALQRYRIDPLK